MIKKIIKIKNIGRFTDYSASGDVELRKLSLIYAENGRGKTTLCDVLRSLQTGDGSHIAGRKTLGSVGEPEACIRLEENTAEFRNGSWTAAYPQIVIFDSAFIHNNVYAGDYVDHEHKKNLYRVIVGEQGVQLAFKVDDLDRRIRDINGEIAQTRTAVQRLTPTRWSIDDFLGLQEETDIDRRIRDQENEIKAFEQSTEIRTKQPLKRIALPSLPENLTVLLGKQLDDLSDGAEAQVRAHHETHLDQRGEIWLEQGLGYIKGDACPFCGQHLGGIALVESYRAYFSEAYRTLKREISDLEDGIKLQLGERAFLGLQGDLNQNESLGQFWKQFFEVDIPTVSFDELRQAVDALRQAAHRLIDQKKGAPLEAVKPDEGFETATKAYEKAQLRISEYNVAIEQVNSRIGPKKAATEAGSLEEARRTLERYKAIKERYLPETITVCQKYQGALENKRILEQEKESAKQLLGEYSSTIFTKYETRINELLMIFNAGFRIGGTKGQYLGGTASSSYKILINNTPVELGDSTTPLGLPCFRNTLSAGDRSTLGLAFFLARLDHDPSIAEKVVVLDDPFTSQDRFRRTCTQQLIRKEWERAKQVIVLSHDPGFLKLVWDNVPHGEVKTLQMARAGTFTVINEWDIETETQAGYFRDHETLMGFDRDGTGASREVVRCIRPLLEGYLRMRFPGHFTQSEWLGDFIDKIRACTQSSSLYPVRSIVVELSDVNDYSKKYHHEQNAGADFEPIDNGELQAYVKRTLNLVGGY